MNFRKPYLLSIALRKTLQWFLFAWLLGACTAPAQQLPPTGLYRKAAAACTVVENNEVKSCADRFQDCLMIVREKDKSYRLEVFSTQALQHVCTVNAPASLLNGALTVLDADIGSGQGVKVVFSENTIILSNLLPVANGQKPFCGARASLDTLRFELTNRVADNGICLPEDLK